MIKEDIIAGLKNAMEKGATLEQAKASFINAGYNPGDVEAAASSMGGVLSKIPETLKQPFQQPRQLQQAQKQPSQQPKQLSQSSQFVPPHLRFPQPKQPQKIKQQKQPAQPQFPQQQKPKSKKIVAIVAVILVLLLIILGVSFIFKDSIISWFS